MQLGLDSYLGVHQDALNIQSKRLEVLSNNLANTDTPNFKARDIDFKAALTEASNPTQFSAIKLATTDSAHLPGETSPNADDALKYRVPLAPSLDGNTVDPQLEQAAFAESTVHYQATLTFLSTRIKNLMTAITGQ